MRITWEQYALQIAQVAALRSEDPYRQVGACALDFENRVIGVAYNGLPPGVSVESSFWTDREARRPYMIHAEINILSLLKRGECALLAITHLPCSSCAQAICAHGIKSVVYIEEYERDTNAKKIFLFAGVTLKQLTIS